MSRQRTNPTLPLGALAAGFGLSLMGSTVLAQTAADAAKKADTALPEVTVEGTVNRRPAAKDSYQVETTNIGKGKQALRDIPQSITVVTEKLIEDRRMDTLKEALHSTAGVTFQAAEGSEEDIRLRGFSLQGTGDIFIDGTRDPAFYERDTFNLDRMELLRGSASMLFGRGSTGGAVNQVSKTPYLENANEINTIAGNYNYVRVTGDFNFKTSDSSALRVTGMKTQADNNGAGSSIDKNGLAAAFRWGIGTSDEFQASLYYLDNDNGINYGMPWIKHRNSDAASTQTINNKLDPDAYYGLKSDYNDSGAQYATLSHQHRFGSNTELKTVIRQGTFTRDQRAGTVRFGNGTDLSNFGPSTTVSRGNPQLKIQDLDALYVQSDLSAKFNTGAVKHSLQSGLDVSKDKKTVYAQRTVAQGGNSVPSRDGTTVGNPEGGAAINEAARTLRVSSQFDSTSWGAYVQDLIQVAPAWKILGGLRYDHLDGNYEAWGYANPPLPAPQVATVPTYAAYQQKIGEWSKRFGVLFQPTALHSFHFSYGTSFNTSGDTYSYSANGSRTPPESSENIELGAKLDTADGRFTTRLAVFRATKNHERNTDAASVGADGAFFELSAKRHVTGFDMDITGHLTKNWEVYLSYTWLPDARVDATSTTSSFGNRVGDRPGLTPKHSGTVWNTYSITPRWRVGGGVNFRTKQSPADIQTQTNAGPGQSFNAPGYATFDLMTDYVINKTFTLKGNINNVGDKLYADSLYRGHYVPGAGRIVQLSLSTKF
ncbi:MAG: TonB-dependent siderophore receptor [Rubrivivax sp.]|nr:MAG: TonB-dependent siderophore receptor [Rubrivivax sp.]